MRFLRTNTAIRLTVGPFFDKTDGITPETAITVTSCKLTFMVDDGNVPTLVLDTNPTASGGANDMVHVAGDDAGFYDLELAAANVNYLGRAMLAITDAATHCPVFHEFMILPAMVYDSMVLGTDVMDASVTQILGTAVSTPATAGILDVNVKNIDNDAASASGTVTFPNATLASTTNITAGTITTATNVTTVNGLAANVITAASMNADASAEIADAVWDEAIAGHAGAGSTGEALSAAGSAGDPWTTALPGAYGAGTAGKIIGDNINAPIATVDTVVDGIATQIGTAGAGLTNITLANDLSATMKTSVQTAAAAALTAYDPPTNAEMETRTMTATTLAKFTASALGVITSTAITGTLTTTTMTTSLTEATDDHYNGRIVVFTSGVLLGQASDITDYTGATKLITMTALTEAPSNGDSFVIL